MSIFRRHVPCPICSIFVCLSVYGLHGRGLSEYPLAGTEEEDIDEIEHGGRRAQLICQAVLLNMPRDAAAGG